MLTKSFIELTLWIGINLSTCFKIVFILFTFGSKSLNRSNGFNQIILDANMESLFISVSKLFSLSLSKPSEISNKVWFWVKVLLAQIILNSRIELAIFVPPDQSVTETPILFNA